jgi:hypothetical protein
MNLQVRWRERLAFRCTRVYTHESSRTGDVGSDLTALEDRSSIEKLKALLRGPALPGRATVG